ncbi:hypothetical protein [Actinokineospora pegani]|uniref:hypothetical protein n=1 Tax=Actinokineospora pegani TaxID=2654637 RepID=UPI0012EA6052|nr:hypothetical protein [Actinokineospora pegani]
MQQPIYADYTTAENGWTVTVTCDGQQAGDRVEGGLVAARDRVDTLVATVAATAAATAGHRPVVHLLDGDALVFTTAYLSERLGIPTDARTGSAGPPVVTAESAPTAVEPDPATAEPGPAPAPPPEDTEEPTG